MKISKFLLHVLRRTVRARSDARTNHQLDPLYFKDASWSDRLESWIDQATDGFAEGNHDVVLSAIEEAESGLRMVVNISAWSLLAFLAKGRYLNLYDKPVIGGRSREPSDHRRTVDEALGLDRKTYFGAVALGGTGVRYYGEYCLVLNLQRIKPDTRVFDRDSYDILLPPLADKISLSLIRTLRGTWAEDIKAMVAMRVLPDFFNQQQLVTTGTVSEEILKDQEFIEVHLRGSFRPRDVEEVRESPDDLAIESRIRDRQTRGGRVTATEDEWARRRDEVAEALDAANVATRVVTLHGRGYQWR